MTNHASRGRGREGYKVGQSRPIPACRFSCSDRNPPDDDDDRRLKLASARVAARFVRVRKSGSDPLEKYKAI